MFYAQQTVRNLSILLFLALLVGGCSKTYYSAMDKVGVHKRDILVDRVEGARDSQTEAQEQFKSALEQFASVVELKNIEFGNISNSMFELPTGVQIMQIPSF